MKKQIWMLAMLALCTTALVACGGQDVASDLTEEELPTPTPPPTPPPTPVPKAYSARVTMTNIHIYENSEPFGQGELFFSFAVNDTIRYSTMISAGNNADYVPADYNLAPIDIELLEGEALFIYVDGYDDDQPNGNDPMGTVNTGWYAGDGMMGVHSVAAANPYRYDITYKIEWAQ